MRTQLGLGASLFLLIACGDDSGGSGGSGTTAATTTSSSPSSTASGDGGGTTSAAGTGGDGGGTGGQGGAGSTSTGSGGPSDTVQEACEQLNAVYDALAEELACPVTPGDCDVPADPCDPELIAFLDCLRTGTTSDDCTCAADPETGEDLLTCTIGDCQAENDAFVECAF